MGSRLVYTIPAKEYVEIRCMDCSVSWLKRKDSLSVWKGRCRKCSSKHASSLPKMKEIHRQNGLNYIKRFGKFNTPKLENRGRQETHWNWKGGITPFRIKIWQSKEYKDWRKSVFERDDYTCQMCDKRGGSLEADHIKSFSLFPEERFNTDNGRTLCVACHRKFGVCVSHGKITREAIFKNNEISHVCT